MKSYGVIWKETWITCKYNLTTSRVTTKENGKKKKKKKRKESITNMLIKKREESYEILSENHKKESLAVQWLGLCAFTAVSSTPWLGT